MDSRPPFYNPFFNQYQTSEIPPQFNNEMSSQFFSQSSNPSQQPQFSYQPYYPYQSQYPSQQPSQSEPPSKQKKTNWSKEEDEALCKAWMMIGEDPVTGTDQQKSTLWERIQTNFQSQAGGTTVRNSKGLMHRFSSLHPSINKFSGYNKTVQDNPISGFNAEDSLQATFELYKRQENKDFKFYHCWKILRCSPKWHDHCKAQQQKQKSSQQIRKRADVDIDINEPENCSESPSTNAGSFQNNSSNPSTPAVSTSINLSDDDSPASVEGSHDLPRPLGRKSTKKGKNKNRSYIEMQNLFVTESQDMKE